MKKILLIFSLVLLTLSLNSQSIIRGNPFPRAIVTAPAGGATENLVLYSEDLTNVAWAAYPDKRVTANTANDLNGAATLDEVETYYAQLWFYQVVSSNISANTLYTISFEASAGSGITNINCLINEHGADQTIAIDEAYAASVTASAQRFSFEFTTPATITGGIDITVVYQTSTANQVVNIGRVHLYSGTIGSKSYITTTSSQEL